MWPTRIHPAHVLPVLVHDLELAGIAAATLTATVVAVVVARRMFLQAPVLSADPVGRRRFELLLPDSFVRDGLTGYFRTLSLLLRPVLLGSQPSVSFTFAVVGERLTITMECGAEIAPSIVSNLEAAIDGIAIDEVAPAEEVSKRRWARCTLRSSGSQWLPFESRHKVDPARFVLAALQCESESGLACVQAVFSPLSSHARRRGRREPRRLRTGRRGGMLAGSGRFGLEVVRDTAEIFLPGGSSSSTQTARPAYTPDHWTLKQAGAIDEKIAEPLLAATIRLAVSGGSRSSKPWRLRALAASFAQFHGLGGPVPAGSSSVGAGSSSDWPRVVHRSQ